MLGYGNDLVKFAVPLIPTIGFITFFRGIIHSSGENIIPVDANGKGCDLCLLTPTVVLIPECIASIIWRTPAMTRKVEGLLFCYVSGNVSL